MADSAGQQVQSMVAFIYQEAHERVAELRLRTDHDYTLELQTVVTQGKVAIHEDFARMEKDAEIADRIERSSALGRARVRKMKERDELLQGLKSDVLAQIRESMTGAGGSKYEQLMQDLITQALMKLHERRVTIVSRPEDVALVNKVAPAAVADYKRRMDEAGAPMPGVEDGGEGDVQVIVETDAQRLLSSRKCSGGIKATAMGGRIVCDNTLETRLEIAYENLLPQIRSILFQAA